ncbi:MAG: hypothetical protein WC378_00645 [Opitutaceae bacterium]|jgi:hypothetical protein
MNNEKPLSTGIEELDSLLRGGIHLPESGDDKDDSGLVVLIRGRAGTGKSTLALQIVTALAMAEMQKRCAAILVNSVVKKEASFAAAAMEVRQQHLFFTIEQRVRELQGIWLRLMQGFLRRRIRILKRIGKKRIRDILPKPSSPLDWKKRFDGKTRYLLHVLLCQLYGEKDEGLSSLDSLWCHKPADKEPWPEVPSSAAGAGFGKTEQKDLTELLKSDLDRLSPINFKDGLPHGGGAVSGDLSSHERPFKSWPSIESVAEMVEKASGNIDVIACDGLSVLAPSERSLMDFRDLVQCLRRRCRLAILVYEPVEKQDEYLDHLCDLVIELAGRQTQAGRDKTYFVYELIIRKARYQDTAYGWHPYKLRAWGLEVFPSIHFQVHRLNLLEDQFLDSFWRETPRDNDAKRDFAGSYLELMLGGIVPGSMTVMLGPRGTFKTSLTHDFLLAGRCALGQRGLLVSLIDDESTLRSKSGLSCPNQGQKANCRVPACGGKKCPLKKSDSGIFLFYQRPGCVLPSEFLQVLHRRLMLYASEDDLIQRLAFWDITQIDHRFPMLSDETMFFPALVILLKELGRQRKKPISSVIIGASNAKNAAAASVMADNVVFLRRATLSEGGNPGDQFLLAYVDRVQGYLGNEGKALYAFPLQVPSTPGEIAQDHLPPIKHYEGGIMSIIGRDKNRGTSDKLARIRESYVVKPRDYEKYKLGIGKNTSGVPEWIETIIGLQDIK